MIVWSMFIGSLALGFGAWWILTWRADLEREAIWRKVSGERRGDHAAQIPRAPRKVSLVFERALPDVFELLALGLQSGENFERAWALAAWVFPPGPLQNELRRAHHLFRVGLSREAVLRQVQSRLQQPRVDGTFALLQQSLKQGSPLQTLLFDQASRLRRERMRRAEHRAQTVGIRLLFPIMIFIFPTLFIILFGSLYLTFLRNGSLF